VKITGIVGLVVAIALSPTSRAEDPSQSPAIPADAVVGPPGVSYAGGNGLDCAQAVRINGAGETMRGIAAERAWLRSRYPGYIFHRQSLRPGDNTSFDVIEIETKEKRRLSICFDIGEFFGK
jgi:hypothetical protein